MLQCSPDFAFIGGGGILVITFAATYAISLTYDNEVTGRKFFLSDSIAEPPESQLGSFGLGIATTLVFISITFRYLQVKMLLGHLAPTLETPLVKHRNGDSYDSVLFKRDPTWRASRAHPARVNVGTYVLGSFCCVCGYGIGCFQVVNWWFIHYACAFGMFFGFLIYQMLHTFYLDIKLSNGLSNYHTPMIRKVTTIMSPILFMGLLVCFHDPAYEADPSHVKPTWTVASAFEIALLLVFATWIVSLKCTNGGLKLRLEVVLPPEPDTYWCPTNSEARHLCVAGPEGAQKRSHHQILQNEKEPGTVGSSRELERLLAANLSENYCVLA